jgi:hypothetical protein
MTDRAGEALGTDVPQVTGGANAPDRAQIKSRQRVRHLAEVYTHQREVDAMLDLVPDMFPSVDHPTNTDRKFLEPACGHGNFLEEILRRKLAFVTVQRYERGESHEHRILRCLASIYGIDISKDNVEESRDRLRAAITSHLHSELHPAESSKGFADAVEVILESNIVCADALADAARVELIDYRAVPEGAFRREWSFPLAPKPVQDDLFSAPTPCRDEIPVHYSELRTRPRPSGRTPRECKIA